MKRENVEKKVKNSTIEDVSLPMVDVLKFSILERRQYVIESMISYERLAGQGRVPLTHIVMAGISALFRELRPALKKDFDKIASSKTFEELEVLVNSKNYEELSEAFSLIDEWLYAKDVTKFDTNTRYDKTSTSEEDRRKGL